MKIRALLLAAGTGLVLLAALGWWNASLSRREAATAKTPDRPKATPTAAPATGKTPGGAKSAVATLRQLMERGQPEPLTPEQLRSLVESHHHSAASLLAAWQLGQDRAWLDEAASRYPDDPHVALAKLSTFPDLNGEAKAWIDRLKANDPENSVGWCYEALSEFKGGSPEAARAALAEAAKRTRFDGYGKESASVLTDAYRSTGMEPLAAEVMGSFSVALPHLSTGMNVAREAIAKLGPNLDDAAVRDILALAKTVRGADGTGYLITDLVSSAMERKMLNELSVLDLVPGTRTFVMERMAELDAEKQQIKDLAAKTQPLILELDDSEMRQYYRRMTVEGELKAMKWLLARHPQK